MLAGLPLVGRLVRPEPKPTILQDPVMKVFLNGHEMDLDAVSVDILDRRHRQINLGEKRPRFSIRLR